MIYNNKQEKEEIWHSPLTKAPIPTDNSKEQRNNTKVPSNIRLHNDCGPTQGGQLEQRQSPLIYGIPTFPLTVKAVYQKDTLLK